MNHNIELKGFRLQLRPVRLDDVKFILSLRTDPDLSRYLNPVSSSYELQIAWLQQYFEAENDYYFVIEDSKTAEPEGLVALYNFDTNKSGAEWGRWILKKSSIRAVESALLIYRVGFIIFDLKSIYCVTMADNSRVVSFHDSCGIKEKTFLSRYFSINGSFFDGIRHTLHRSAWPEIDARLSNLASRLSDK
jgi:RimJ/RimL family protein N-acetyltransferase